VPPLPSPISRHHPSTPSHRRLQCARYGGISTGLDPGVPVVINPDGTSNSPVLNAALGSQKQNSIAAWGPGGVDGDGLIGTHDPDNYHYNP
jgi:hypothetical protein